MYKMRSKLKSLINYLLFLLSKKKILLDNSTIGQINVSKKSISVFSLSTNPIVSFTIEDKLYFFRECPRIYSKRAFLENAIARFFYFLGNQRVDKEIFKEEIPIRISFSQEEISRFKEYIVLRQQERSFYKKITNADFISDRVGFNIWTNQEYKFDFFNQFGLHNLPTELFDIAILFLWHMRSSFLRFKIRKISQCQDYSFFEAGKTIATNIVAEELGIGNVVVEAQLAYLVLDDGVRLLGVITPKAEGCRARDSHISSTPMLQKKLHDLFLLDNICFQTDHGPDNYNVYCNGNTCSVRAFDNDNPQTFAPLPYIKKSLAGCDSFISSKGFLMCPFVTEGIFQRIEANDFKTMKGRLKPYLNILQIYALLYRIRIVRKAIMKSYRYGKLNIMNENDWNEKTVQMELNGNFGETYLTKLMKAIG